MSVIKRIDTIGENAQLSLITLPLNTDTLQFNGNFPYFAGNKSNGPLIKHYLYATEFFEMFPSEDNFKNKFSCSYNDVKFPTGYDNR